MHVPSSVGRETPPFTLPSTMAVQLIHLFAAGLHGDGHAHPTTTRCHACHLSPSIHSGIVTFNTVQEGIAIIATCRKRVSTIKMTCFILLWQGSGPDVPLEDEYYCSLVSKTSQKLHSSTDSPCSGCSCSQAKGRGRSAALDQGTRF